MKQTIVKPISKSEYQAAKRRTAQFCRGKGNGLPGNKIDGPFLFPMLEIGFNNKAEKKNNSGNGNNYYPIL